MKNTIIKSNKKTIGIVFDVVKNLQKSHDFFLPHDALSEWESKETIEIICDTWKSLNHDVILFPIDNNFLNQWAHFVNQCDVIHSIAEGYGSLARESWIPSLCELSGIPCIGSNPFVHSMCMNKHYTKLVCEHLQIPTAESFLINSLNDIENVPDIFLSQPHFIKPNGEGSGMGVDSAHSISSKKSMTLSVVKKLLEFYPNGILLEKYLPGSEFTTGIVGLKQVFLPIAQIEVCDGVYGSANKSKDYLSEKITFPEISEKIYNILQEGSQKLFSYLNMSDMARLDWKCDADGNPYFLEANTLPGLSKIYSTLPLMTREAGIEYKELFNLLFESAYSRKNERNFWYGKTRINSHPAIYPNDKTL